MKKICLRLGLLAAAASAIGLAACGGSSTTNINLGGSVTGLTADGLVLTDGITTVTLSANTTTFSFPSRVNVGASYRVAVQTQPAGLTCSVANAAGVAGSSDIGNVQITCVQNYNLGGTITGLTGAGLVLANGSDTVSPLAGSGAFVFPTKVGNGFAYGVTVLTQPAGQTCTVVNGAGYMGTADVTSVQVNCV